MKKLFTVFLIVTFLVPCFALADLPDLSDLSYEELVKLRGMVQRAIWDTDEWQSVTVPAGVYRIGDEIPAGHWTIQTSVYSLVAIHYGKKLTEPGTEIDYSTSLYDCIITLDLERKNELHQIDIILKEGNYISFSGEVIFYPYNGKLNFTFNKGN